MSQATCRSEIRRGLGIEERRVSAVQDTETSRYLCGFYTPSVYPKIALTRLNILENGPLQIRV